MKILKHIAALSLVLITAGAAISISRINAARTAYDDIPAFIAKNSDFFGILEIKDTLREPVVQGPDNSYYLTHALDGSADKNGCLFADMQYREGCGNLVIYGHNSFNGTGFSDLAKFKEPGFADSHRRIRLVKKDRTICTFRVAMVLNYCVDDIAVCDPFAAQLPADHLPRCRKYAVYDTGEGVRADCNSGVLTLSTCDETLYGSAGRLVIIAIREA